MIERTSMFLFPHNQGFRELVVWYQYNQFFSFPSQENDNIHLNTFMHSPTSTGPIKVLEVIQWRSPPMSRYSIAPFCRWMLNMGSERAGGEPGSVRLWGHSGHQHWPLSAILWLTSREVGVSGETSRVTFVGTLSHRSLHLNFPPTHHYEARKYGPRSSLLRAHEHIQLWQPSDIQGQVWS